MKLDEMLTAVSKLYGQPLEPMVLAMYESALSGQSEAYISEALSAHVATSPFMPKPSEILALIRKAHDPALNWAESWAELFSGHGVTSDRVGQRALVAMGGWQLVGYSDFSRIPYLQSRFQAIYETLTDGEIPALPKPAADARLQNAIRGLAEIKRLKAVSGDK